VEKCSRHTLESQAGDDRLQTENSLADTQHLLSQPLKDPREQIIVRCAELSFRI